MADGAPVGDELCHVQVQFASPPLRLDYQAERPVADRFAAAAPGIGAAVTIDNELVGNFPPLPCQKLWS